MAYFKWFGNQFLDKMEKEEAKRITRACIFVANNAKKEMGTKSPPPSSAGEYPHAETGQLRASISWEIDKDELKGRVGTNKVYGRYLEKGTANMEARPFLEKTLELNQEAIRQILTKKIT